MFRACLSLSVPAPLIARLSTAAPVQERPGPRPNAKTRSDCGGFARDGSLWADAAPSVAPGQDREGLAGPLTVTTPVADLWHAAAGDGALRFDGGPDGSVGIAGLPRTAC